MVAYEIMPPQLGGICSSQQGNTQFISYSFYPMALCAKSVKLLLAQSGIRAHQSVTACLLVGTTRTKAYKPAVIVSYNYHITKCCQ